MKNRKAALCAGFFIAVTALAILFALTISVCGIAASDVPYTAYTASQTMDIGIASGIIALTVSAVVIYFLRRNRRR